MLNSELGGVMDSFSFSSIPCASKAFNINLITGCHKVGDRNQKKRKVDLSSSVQTKLKTKSGKKKRAKEIF